MKKTLAAVALLLCSVLVLSACGAHFHKYTQTIVPSTCRSMGYTLLVCDCGDRQYREYAAIASHQYGEWQAYTKPTLIAFGEELRTCIHCGNLEFRTTALEGEIPSLFLKSTGDFSLVVGTEKTQYQATLQTHGGLEGEKAGYTLAAVRCEKQNGMDLGYGITEGFFLDPCTPDRTFARAGTAEALWQSSLALRRQAGLLPAWVPVTESRTVTVRVFMNNAYAGLYRLIPTLSLNGQSSAVILTESEDPACLFAEPPRFDGKDFSLLSYGGDTPDAALESFAKFSAFVSDSSPEQFRLELENYTDITALMDYLILCNFFGLPTGDTSGTVWSTADGIHWIPSFHSLNNAFGLSAKGYQNTAFDGIPAMTNDPNGITVPYEGKNLLWEKLCAAFPIQLRARYETLRETFLKKQNVCDLFAAQFQSIDDSLRKEERDLYTPLPGTAWASRYVEEYVQTRLRNMDEWLYPIKFAQPS